MDVGRDNGIEMNCRRLSVGMPPGIRGCKPVQCIREGQYGQLSERTSLKQEVFFLKMKSIDFPCFVGVFMIINILHTSCIPINMCAGSNGRSNVFQISSSETLADSIPRLLQKFQHFIRNLGEFINILNERGLRGDQHLLEAVTSSESLDGFPDLDLQPVSGDMDEQLLKDYNILLKVRPFVEHMYQIEKDSDRQLYTSNVNGIYSVLEDLICEFYSILLNREGVIPPLDTIVVVPDAYKEMSTASRHLYHYLVARDMQHIVSLLDNRYRDM